MSPHDRHGNRTILQALRDRNHDFRLWIAQLRDSDPTFAAASVLAPEDWGEYQAGAYLITGSHEIWTTLGSDVLAQGSLGPVVWELEDPSRGWSSGERMLLRWAAHFWNIDATEASFPCGLDDGLFRRWISACHLRQHTAPEMAILDGGAA